MKKQFTIFLILIFTLGLVPVNFSEAITQNQISSEVQIVCTDGADSWFSGSGTIIDPKGIILTNRHVVEGAYKNLCFIGFLESINQEPNFGPQNSPNLAEVKYMTTTKDMDAAVLYLDNKNNKIYPYINIWNSSSSNLKFGDKIEVVGYPGIGGSTLTYTSGDFSGFGGQADNTQNYIKTTALLEHGNSGGSSYNQKGEFVGIPSMVVSGSLNSIGYILSVDSIKKWLSGFLGNDYKQEVIEQKPVIAETTKTDLQTDITPPNFNVLEKLCYKVQFKYSNLDTVSIGGRCFPPKLGKIEEFNHIQFSVDKSYLQSIEPSGLKKIYYYFDNIPHNQIDNNAIQYEPKDINSNEISITQWIDIKSSGKYYFSFFGEDNYGNISNAYIYEYVYEGEDFKLIESVDVYDRDKKLIGTISYPQDYYDINHGVVMGYGKPEDQLNVIYTNQSELYLKPKYKIDTGDISYLATKNKFCEQATCENGIVSKDGMMKWNKDVNLMFFKPGNNNSFNIKHNALTIIYKSSLKNKISKDTKAGFIVNENNTNSKLVGKILLQVESHGEAWYVNPKNSKKYYMANGDEAYKVMRILGVGITNKDLEKIKTNKTFAKNSSGKIFLQVEANGEAYYIDFNGIAHYLKNGSAAYTIMRELGLGITNNDLSKIPEGSL